MAGNAPPCEGWGVRKEVTPLSLRPSPRQSQTLCSPARPPAQKAAIPLWEPALLRCESRPEGRGRPSR